MRRITNLALCLLTTFTLASCSTSDNKREVADDRSGAEVQKEYRQGKRLINETNY